MILLSEEARGAFEHLKNVPTHAELVHQQLTFSRNGQSPTDTFGVAMHPDDHMLVVYVFGELGADGALVVNANAGLAQVLVDLKDYSGDAALDTYSESMKAHLLERAAAAKNLLGAGVVPTPGAPHQSTKVRKKPAREFRFADVDAIVAYFDPRLSGTVV